MIKLLFKRGAKMALKDVIKDARLKKNLKQEDAANLVGVTVQTYSKWENGKTEPKASQVAKLSKILGVSTNEICNGEKSRKLEIIKFMSLISGISNDMNDFDFIMAIWNSLDDDCRFLDNLKHYHYESEQYLDKEENYRMQKYVKEVKKDPNLFDEDMELLKKEVDEEKQIDYLNSLDNQ
jgi:transcriptional regulator with XRE-family HTH domain